MNKIFNITSTFKSKTQEDGSLKIKGMASTISTDRAGDIIISEAWEKGGLSNFKKNPIILFNHNYDKPVGKATSVTSTPEGLELEATLSANAPDSVTDLVKEGILRAFSVGFRIKDADYISETDGLLIKDVELFEVSVVSVPMNQDATFSVAKSFESLEDYNEFKKTITHSVDLAGQNLATEDENSSNLAGSAQEKGTNLPDQEINMTKEELEALAKQVAESTAANMAMKQAEAKAAEDKLAAEATAKAVASKAAAAEEAKTVEAIIKTGIETGAEKLLADMKADLDKAKGEELAEVAKKYEADLAEKAVELEAMRNSKRTFEGRGEQGDLSKWGKDFMHAHIFGVITGKGMDTEFAKDIIAKAADAGVNWTAGAPDIAQEISNQIAKEVLMETKLAGLFKDFQVNGAATVLPIQPDADKASWQTGVANTADLDTIADGAASAAGFRPQQVILKAFRLLSQTFLDNDIDEQVLINLMPMMVENIARAHARAVDSSILGGSAGNFNGLIDGDVGGAGSAIATDSGTNVAASALTAAALMDARKSMGKYGIRPSDVTYVTNVPGYYALIEDQDFADVDQVGAAANKTTGSVGSVYGSPVVISDEFATPGTGVPHSLAINTANFVMPRLRNITVERDYEVGKQRNLIVAYQALGFQGISPGFAGNRTAVSIEQA